MVEFAQPKVCIVQDAMSPAYPNDVKFEGYLGDKMNRLIRNALANEDVDHLIHPIKNQSGTGSFSGEFFGKWYHAAVLGYQYQPSETYGDKLDYVIRQLAAAQAPNGYLGTYDEANRLSIWDVWEQKYILLGLLYAYQFKGDTQSLEIAGRSADYLLTLLGPGKTDIANTGTYPLKGLTSYTILEPFALLYQFTGEPRYLEFAEYIAGRMELPTRFSSKGENVLSNALKGVPPIEYGGHHAYMMMSLFEGLCELYRATGKALYLEAAVQYALQIRKTEIMLTGSGSNSELWCNGSEHQTEMLEQPMETCTTTTWTKLCFQLLRLTGDSMWADEMEITLYNSLLGAMMPDGNWWAYHSPLQGERAPSKNQLEEMHTSCCVRSGPRGVMITPAWAYMSSSEGPVVNYYGSSIGTIRLVDGTKVTLTQQSDYPVQNKTELIIKLVQPSVFELKLRIPSWSLQTFISVNGEAVEWKAGSYASIEREWKDGDRVTLELDLRGRVIMAPSGAPQSAVMRGPVVLALDSRLTSPMVKTIWLLPQPYAYSPIADPGAESPEYSILPKTMARPKDPWEYVELKPVEGKAKDIWMAFEVPFVTRPSHFINHQPLSLIMCDYASAGNLWDESNLFKVWIPLPLYMKNMYPEDSWKLLGRSTTRPEVPIKRKVTCLEKG